MPRSSFQKLKIIYIMEYLLKNSDEDHAVTTSQIIAYLKSHDITAERKTIYSDIDALRDFGLDIIQVSEGNNHGYYVASRDFELPELKLLVDSVQSSKFITHKKTLSLIKKIEKLASIHSAQLLNRQVFVKNRIKTMNESISTGPLGAGSPYGRDFGCGNQATHQPGWRHLGTLPLAGQLRLFGTRAHAQD